MDNLVSILNKSSALISEKLDQIYPLFAISTLENDEQLGKFRSETLPQLYKLFEEKILQKDIVFLSLLTNDDPRVVHCFFQYEISQPVNLHKGFSLFARCYYDKCNWFGELFESSSPHFKPDLVNELNAFKVLKYTNGECIQCDKIGDALRDVQVDLLEDEFLKQYLNEIKYTLSIVDFIKRQNANLDSAELFRNIIETKLLKVFFRYLNLQNESIWTLTSQLLLEEENRVECNSESLVECRDVDQFDCYTVLFNVIKVLRNHCFEDVTLPVTQARRKISELGQSLQVDLWEDIFALCFLKKRHLNVDDGDGFVCTDKELRLLLHFLKTSIEENPKVHLGSPLYTRYEDVNRHIKEALWRLEMLDDLEEFHMGHMLVDAETLISTSLKKNRFNKVHQVIKIFALEESDLAKEIYYTEKLNYLRATLQQAFKVQDLQREMPQLVPHSEKTPWKLLNEFFKPLPDRKDEDTLDIILTLPTNRQNTRELLSFVEKRSPFCEKISVLFEKYEDVSLHEIICNPKYNFDHEMHTAQLEHLKVLHETVHLLKSQIHSKSKGSLSNKHVAHKTFTTLREVIGSKGNCNYFHRLVIYLKLLLKIFYIEGNNSDLIAQGNAVSYFELLKFSRSDLVGKLIFERKLDPGDLEPLFGKLKIDLLYHLTSNCFPRITFVQIENAHIKEALVPTKAVFSYIERRNWLLAFMIDQIFHLNFMDVNENRTKYFCNFVKSDQVNNLKILYKNNRVIAALNKFHFKQCVEYLDKNVFDTESLTSDEVDKVEDAEEISEEDNCNWLYLLKLIESIPKWQLDEQADILRDKILSNLVTDKFEEEGYKYVRFIKDINLRTSLILENFSTWPGDFCVQLLKAEADPHLNKWSQHIKFCEGIRHRFDFISWFPVHELCMYSPQNIFEQLLLIPKVSNLLMFQKIYGPTDLLKNISLEYVELLFNSNEDLSMIEQLLDQIQSSEVICLNLLRSIRNLRQLDFIIKYLSKCGFDDTNYIKNVKVGSKMLTCFPHFERDQLWPLIGTPLAIIEMLLMNTKLDKLGLLLDTIKDTIQNCEFSESVISLESIDELLRKYAEKSLEFRVILDPHPKLFKGSEGKLMESLDSIYSPDRELFRMPEKVPSKADWIPNNQVIECMCCQNTIFSMFNRRHHCRRCGRVICFNCSPKRMLVPSYGDILVRVCIDCYDQSQPDTRSDTISLVSLMHDDWCLSDNQEHNVIVRQEFSYEHAPSVSLCLSIMKHHTKTYSYPKFLLDQCDVMLKLLQPPQPNVPQEVDYALVIKMLKSLAIAAKMLSSECELSWGASQADRILSQSDLLSLLAERGCLNLLPHSSGAPHVDAIVLRKLRDKLLVQEQWHFALDVSTKAGLDNGSVFAAWGRSCLKAGCLQMAREKFSRCLDKSGHYDSISLSLEDDSYDSVSRTRYTKISTGSIEPKPLKNPPLLDQIVNILESQTVRTALQSANPKGKDAALLIKAKLKNLKAVSAGNLEGNMSEYKDAEMNPLLFQECVYYLKKYGTHLSLLQFYLRHNCIKAVLDYILENNIQTDIFVEVYVTCLKDGIVRKLQKQMTNIDTTLEIWKDYLRAICRHLEKQGLLNSLYQLQQFMVDYVRAAMTCIRFYKDNATSYSELASRIHHLDQAESHLRQELEQQQWVEVNAVCKTSDESKNSYADKSALSNPSLVMKMSSRSIDMHIRTIKRQIQLTRFLSKREKGDKYILNLLPQIAFHTEEESNCVNHLQMPTLFDSYKEKMQLAIICIICGETVQEGYQMASSIIQDYKLKPIKIYCQTGRQLAKEERHKEIAELVHCVKSNGTNDAAVNDICDEMLTLVVRTLSRNDAPTSQMEVLIKLITDRAAKISIYIETKQLKSAYLLAVKYNRIGDIRKILREAELLNKPEIKKLCQKLLQTHSHSPKD